MTEIPTVAVRAGQVTLLDVYRSQVEMGGKLDLLDERLKAIPDHEARIRVLEASRAKFLGACLALSSLAGAAAGWVALLITHR